MSDSESLPKFFDLQVNGFFGADFNDASLSESQLDAAVTRLQQDNVSGILATVITDSNEAMLARVRRIVELRKLLPAAAAMIPGLHIEGPFISSVTGYIGAHPAAHARQCEQGFMEELLAAGEGLIRLVTIAPEQDPGGKLTRWLVDQNVVVAAGHCDPSVEQLATTIDQGLSMFTHLGNGCPQLMHRHDNIIQRVLSMSDRLVVCMIADGFHVPLVALQNYIRCIPPENLVFTTDCIAAAGLGAGVYTLAGQQIRVEAGMPPTSADGSHFVGSSAQMPDMYRRLRDELGISQKQLEYSMFELPRRATGCA
ncbi:N-acetylglucosamine-6-phosphate deacetylase [Rosistilla oblonga]|uniref:N-acetylglucosamine-6-phosphate deacetylase n=1 Tax=Rosistilla oblonga TaxID=2527990 RepID=UPI003A98760F